MLKQLRRSRGAGKVSAQSYESAGQATSRYKVLSGELGYSETETRPKRQHGRFRNSDLDRAVRNWSV